MVCTGDGAGAVVNAAHLFPRATTNASQGARTEPRIGAEIELLPRDRETQAIAQLDGSLGEWLQSAARAGSWQTTASKKGAPKYELARGGTVTLEPGGQVEYSSTPHRAPGALIEQVKTVVQELEESAHAFGIDLIARGIDPKHSLEETPLQLTADRYMKMDAYLRTISGAGARMMRQTAAIQVSIDAAHDPVLTWHVLNRAAPVLTALFANSRIYESRDTGFASYRAQMWRDLDASRTGVCTESLDPADEYTQFAMKARSIADAPQYRPFAALTGATESDWVDHLSTLFPEVRPRQHFEVRCMDMIPVDFVAAPLLIVAALAWDITTLQTAAAMLPAAYDDSLRGAARFGLGDEALSVNACRLVELATDACARRGGEFCSAEDRVMPKQWLERSLAARGAPFEHDFTGDDHVTNDAIACLGE